LDRWKRENAALPGEFKRGIRNNTQYALCNFRYVQCIIAARTTSTFSCANLVSYHLGGVVESAFRTKEAQHACRNKEKKTRLASFNPIVLVSWSFVLSIQINQELGQSTWTALLIISIDMGSTTFTQIATNNPPDQIHHPLAQRIQKLAQPVIQNQAQHLVEEKPSPRLRYIQVLLNKVTSGKAFLQ
jgi:hypothetical protein